MSSDENTYPTDTLDISNISSLQSDSTTGDTVEVRGDTFGSKKMHACFCNVKLIPCTMDGGRCSFQQYHLKNPEVHRSIPKEALKDWERLNWKYPRQSFVNEKNDKSKNKKSNHQEKLNAKHETLDGLPRVKQSKKAPNPELDSLYNEKDAAEKIDIYYFDHGNSAYYHTTDVPPILKTEKCAERTNTIATTFWAEIFGYVHLGVSFVVAFVLQFIRFVLFSIIRPLTVGVIQMIADYFLKPLLSMLFNGLVQPFLILLYNVATSFRDCCEPLAAALGFFIREIAVLFRACRLVEINNNHYNDNNPKDVVDST